MKTKLRNSAARSPLLRKGGVHEKSKSGQRSRDKVKLFLAMLMCSGGGLSRCGLELSA
jgi:hypothetical protein